MPALQCAEWCLVRDVSWCRLVVVLAAVVVVVVVVAVVVVVVVVVSLAVC